MAEEVVSPAPVPSPAPGPQSPLAALFNGSNADVSTASAPGYSAVTASGVGSLSNTGANSGQLAVSRVSPLSDKVEAGHSHCGAGCIAGAVIGSVLGVVLIFIVVAFIWMYCRRRRMSTRSVTGSQLDLLEDSISSAQGFKLCHQRFDIGDKVFCKDNTGNGSCLIGTVVAHAGDDLYKVRFQDGVIALHRNSHMAPHYQSDASVQYMPPDGSMGINCTVLTADGSYWPPFYHLQPMNNQLDSINTTAEHLVAPGKPTIEVFGSDIHARAV